MLEEEKSLFRTLQVQLNQEEIDLKKLIEIANDIIYQIDTLERQIAEGSIDQSKLMYLEQQLDKLKQVIQYLIERGLEKGRGCMHQLLKISRQAEQNIDIAKRMLEKSA